MESRCREWAASPKLFLRSVSANLRLGGGVKRYQARSTRSGGPTATSSTAQLRLTARANDDTGRTKPPLTSSLRLGGLDMSEFLWESWDDTKCRFITGFSHNFKPFVIYRQRMTLRVFREPWTLIIRDKTDRPVEKILNVSVWEVISGMQFKKLILLRWSKTFKPMTVY